MDTRWKKWKAGISLLCFLLGGLLLLGSVLLGVAGISNWDRVADSFQDDYQNTKQFQQIMSHTLNDLLEAVTQRSNKAYQAAASDPNILCEVLNHGRREYASNPDISLRESPPEGYNFYLYYDGREVTVTKDGQAVDVYGDGYYRQGQGWDVPGFLNVDTGEGDPFVEVYLAAPAVAGVSGELFYMTQGLAQGRQIVLLFCVIPAVGLLLFGLYIFWRKDKKRADMAIACVTGRIWAEFKSLIFLSLFLIWRMSRTNYRWQMILFPLLCLFLLYFAINDLRYNGWHKTMRQSLCGTISRVWRCEELKRPVERRLQRRAVAIFIAVIPFALGTMLWGFSLFQRTWGRSSWILGVFLLALLGLLLLLAQVHFLRLGIADAHELALLTDQIEALKSGDYAAPAEFPQDADLHAAAESLAGLRRGMEHAIAERTRSERMKVELITNVSHDLKTPLTSVVSYAELLSREEDLPDHVRDYIAILGDKAQRLKTMVGDVFEVSKAASGALSLHTERLDLGKLLRQTLADMATPIEESGQALVPAIPEEPVYIDADGDRLYRVFQNLLQNALQYSLEGTRVYLTLSAGDGSTAVTLKNISRDPLPAGVDLTERFVRGDESRTDGGSGLGLAIASSFTNACGGQLNVSADADLFTAEVRFPISN